MRRNAHTAIAAFVITLAMAVPVAAVENPRTAYEQSLAALLGEFESLDAELFASIQLLEKTANLTGEEALQRVEKHAEKLNRLIDQLQDDSPVYRALDTFDLWAREHRARVEKEEGLSAEDREADIVRWDKLIEETADKRVALGALRSDLIALAKEMRSARRQMAELILLDQGKEALERLGALIGKAQTVAANIRSVISGTPAIQSTS